MFFVLIVDDNRDVRETLMSLLDIHGYEVYGAQNGKEALEIAETLHPNVILSDLSMPEMDGVELAKAIKAKPDLRDTYLIAFSAWGSPEMRQRTATAGFSRHLVKPAAVGEVVAALEDAKAAVSV